MRPPPLELLRRRARAGAELIERLGRAGLHVPPAAAAAGLGGLAPFVERYVHTRTPHGFAYLGGAERDPLQPANAFPGSFLLVQAPERQAGLELELAGRRVRYHLVVYDRVLVPCYEAWRAGCRPAVQDAEEQPLVRLFGDVVWVDRGRLAALAEERLYGRAAYYRELARRYPEPAARLALPARARAALARDLLRWRALQGLYRTTHVLAPAERARRFACARTRTEARTAAAWLLFSATRDPVRRQAQAALALLEGPEPLDALATLVGLYAGPAPAVAEPALRAYLAAVHPELDLQTALAYLPEARPEDCRAAVRHALRPGGLLAMP
ncbi:MAG: hypothetical protein KatS3mg102_1124 [Planctomycetota bacterium]|nr:MAG: hypothetical protein KatS3mg102_1124 [Planctomycetota bacterium]